MKKRIGITQFVFIIYLIIVVVYITHIVFITQNYNSGWNAAIDAVPFEGKYSTDLNEKYENYYIDETKINCDYENKVIFSGHLTQSVESDEHLFFMSYYLDVEVFVNGVQVFENTVNDVPDVFHSTGKFWCKIPGYISTKDEITIVLRNPYINNYKDAYSKLFATMCKGDVDVLMIKTNLRYLPYKIYGVLTIFAGIILIVIVVSLKLRKMSLNRETMACGMLMCALGIMNIMHDEYLQLALHNGLITMALYTINISFIYILAAIYMTYFYTGKVKQITVSVVLLTSILSAVGLIVSLTGYTDIFEVRLWLVIYILMMNMVSLVINTIEIRKKNKNHNNVVLFSFYALSIGSSLEVFNYFTEWIESMGFVFIGFSVFIFCQFYVSISHIARGVDRVRKNSEMEKELMQKKVSIMLSQIQPHFLYNSLNSIRTLCITNPEQADSALLDFSEFLRGNMDSLSSESLISFEKELNHVKNYLRLEQVCYEERLKVIYDIETIEFSIPALTVQPIVENAVRHGVTKKREGGTVMISTKEEGDKYIIIIEDNGNGFDINIEKNDDRSHIGIENVRNRISDQCNGTMKIESELGIGTKVTLAFPREVYANDNNALR